MSPPAPRDPLSDLLVSRLLEHANRVRSAVQERRLLDAGLTAAQWGVLRELAGTALGMGELAQRVGCQTSNLTPVVDRLARAGWLRRSRRARDRRAVRVRLTPKGEALRQRVQEALQLQQADLLRGLSARERVQVCRLLEKFIAGAEQYREAAA